MHPELAPPLQDPPEEPHLREGSHLPARSRTRRDQPDGPRWTLNPQVLGWSPRGDTDESAGDRLCKGGWAEASASAHPRESPGPQYCPPDARQSPRSSRSHQRSCSAASSPARSPPSDARPTTSSSAPGTAPTSAPSARTCPCSRHSCMRSAYSTSPIQSCTSSTVAPSTTPPPSTSSNLVNLVNLDDGALRLLRAGVQREVRPDGQTLEALAAAFGEFLDTMDGIHITDDAGTSPHQRSRHSPTPTSRSTRRPTTTPSRRANVDGGCCRTTSETTAGPSTTSAADLRERR